MPRRDIITIGGSAGQLEALKRIVTTLQPDLDAAILAVIHLSARGRSYLPQILRMQTRIPVREAVERDLIQPGHIYVAPPDRHLLIGENHLHLTRGPKEGLHRPSINITFAPPRLPMGTASSAYCFRVCWTTAHRDCGKLPGVAASPSFKIPTRRSFRRCH